MGKTTVYLLFFFVTFISTEALAQKGWFNNNFFGHVYTSNKWFYKDHIGWLYLSGTKGARTNYPSKTSGSLYVSSKNNSLAKNIRGRWVYPLVNSKRKILRGNNWVTISGKRQCFTADMRKEIACDWRSYLNVKDTRIQQGFYDAFGRIAFHWEIRNWQSAKINHSNDVYYSLMRWMQSNPRHAYNTKKGVIRNAYLRSWGRGPNQSEYRFWLNRDRGQISYREIAQLSGSHLHKLWKNQKTEIGAHVIHFTSVKNHKQRTSIANNVKNLMGGTWIRDHFEQPMHVNNVHSLGLLEAKKAGLKVLSILAPGPGDYKNYSEKKHRLGHQFKTGSGQSQFLRDCGYDKGAFSLDLVDTKLYKARLDSYLKTTYNIFGQKIEAFEVGNEFDWRCFNGDLANKFNDVPNQQAIEKFVNAYIRFFNASYETIRDYDKNAKVIIFGHTTCGNNTKGCIPAQKIADQLRKTKAGQEVLNRADGVAIHGYIWSNNENDVKNFVSKVNGIGRTYNKPVYITEFGVGRSGVNRDLVLANFFKEINSASVSVPLVTYSSTEKTHNDEFWDPIYLKYRERGDDEDNWDWDSLRVFKVFNNPPTR